MSNKINLIAGYDEAFLGAEAFNTGEPPFYYNAVSYTLIVDAYGVTLNLGTGLAYNIVNSNTALTYNTALNYVNALNGLNPNGFLKTVIALGALGVYETLNF